MSPSLAKRHARAAQPREDAEWWVIEVQVEELRGCTMKGGYTVVARHHLVSVGVRIAVNEEVVKIPEVKTYPFPKNPRAKGADWTVAHPEVPKGETTPILLRVFASRDDAVSLKFTAYERLKSDLIETHRNGDGELAVELPRVAAVESRVAVPLAYGGKLNGTVVVTVRACPERRALSSRVTDWWRPALALLLVCLVMAARFCGASRWSCLFLSALTWGPWLLLELPMFLGSLLTTILAVAVPGLGLSMRGLTVTLGFYKDRSSPKIRHLMLAARVDDLKLAHDPKQLFYHENFVAAKTVRLALSFDVPRIAASAMEAWRMARLRDASVATSAVLRLSCVGLKGVDEWFTAAATSDPFVRVLLVPKLMTDAAICEDFDADTLVELCRTEIVPCEASPSFEPIAVPLDVLRRKLRDGTHHLLFAVYDHDDFSEHDLIGMARLDLSPSTRAGGGGETTLELKATLLSEERVGELAVSVEYVHENSTAAFDWSPFPTVHHAVRDSDPTRLGTIIVHEFKADGVTIAFDTSKAHGEFNVCSYVRGLAEGKVQQTLGSGAKIPNLVRVAPLRVLLPQSGGKMPTRVKATFEIRGQRRTTALVDVVAGVAVFEAQELSIACADPSAVLLCKVLDERKRLVGQWVVTLKMLVVAPTNVHGRELTTGLDPPKWFGRAPKGSLRGLMQLRDKNFLLHSRKIHHAKSKDAPEIELEVRWYHVATEKSHEELLNETPMKALEQLQVNSAETNLKLGNIALLKQMLKDFPLLFDVRNFEINDINFYLKALFMGYEGDHSDEAIFVHQIDFRDTLASPEGSNGQNLKALAFSVAKAMVGPILVEVSIFESAGHILSGVMTGIFSRSASHVEEHLSLAKPSSDPAFYDRCADYLSEQVGWTTPGTAVAGDAPEKTTTFICGF